MVYTYHSFLVHSSPDGHLGCFHVLAMINSAAMNIGVHVSLSDLVSLVCITLYAEQKKRHRRIEQSFGLCGRRRGWDVSREQHWNMYII